MARRFYLIERDDLQEVHELPAGVALPSGGVEVPRLPDCGERWQDGSWVLDAALCADMNADPEAVKAAQLQKRIEALLIKSGIELQAGLLVDEAPLRGVSLDAMADLVMDAAGPAMQAELDRMAAKTGRRTP